MRIALSILTEGTSTCSSAPGVWHSRCQVCEPAFVLVRSERPALEWECEVSLLWGCSTGEPLQAVKC